MKKMSSKAFKKRFRLTRNNKIIRRQGHIGHNQAKQSTQVKNRRKGQKSLTDTYNKIIKRYL